MFLAEMFILFSLLSDEYKFSSDMYIFILQYNTFSSFLS